MMGIEYLSKFDKREIEQIVRILETNYAGFDFRFQNDYLWLEIELPPLESDENEESVRGIVDTYLLDDYLIDAYDVHLDSDTLFDYRKFMYKKFGEKYAEKFLFTYVCGEL